MIDVVELDIGGFATDKTYNECIDLCVQLKLIEVMRHGNEDYARFTQTGINVLGGLIAFAGGTVNPEDKLKVS